MSDSLFQLLFPICGTFFFLGITLLWIFFSSELAFWWIVQGHVIRYNLQSKQIKAFCRQLPFPLSIRAYHFGSRLLRVVHYNDNLNYRDIYIIAFLSVSGSLYLPVVCYTVLAFGDVFLHSQVLRGILFFMIPVLDVVYLLFVRHHAHQIIRRKKKMHD